MVAQYDNFHNFFELGGNDVDEKWKQITDLTRFMWAYCLSLQDVQILDMCPRGPCVWQAMYKEIYDAYHLVIDTMVYDSQ